MTRKCRNSTPQFQNANDILGCSNRRKCTKKGARADYIFYSFTEAPHLEVSLPEAIDRPINLLTLCRIIRPPDKSVYLKFIFVIIFN